MTCENCANYQISQRWCLEWNRPTSPDQSCARYLHVGGEVVSNVTVHVTQNARRVRLAPMTGRRRRRGATISRRSLHVDAGSWRAIGRPARVFVEVDPVARIIAIVPGDGKESYRVSSCGALSAPSLIERLAQYGFGIGRYAVTIVDGELQLRRSET